MLALDSGHTVGDVTTPSLIGPVYRELAGQVVRDIRSFDRPMCQRSCRLNISEDNHAPLFTGT